MEKKKQINIKNIPTKIEIGVYWYEDEETGEIHFDYDEMLKEFESTFAILDKSFND